MSAFHGGLNWSVQHSNLLSKMECVHEAATSHLLLGGPAVRDLGSLAGRRADEFDRTPICPGVPVGLLGDLASRRHPSAGSAPCQTGAQPFWTRGDFSMAQHAPLFAVDRSPL